MSKIHILTADVSNKIAAGEVVERPASAVKELIENAVDAGATAITIEVKNGGISYIRVTDNGSGMDYDDAVTAFLRHATSKITSESDLESISTLGFRGEALASIAAVSHIELMTKTENNDGVYIELDAGEIVRNETVGCQIGTTIVIKNLFYNTPARMKFLKKDKTETGYISDIVERLVLSNPHISLKYIVDGKEQLFFGGDGQLKSCVYSVYGRDYAKAVSEIERNTNNIKVSGLVGRSEVSRGNRSFQSFFVNGRYVKNRALTYSAEAAYKNILMTGKFPFFVIHINIPFDLVDINVHPTKQEVKFADERAVCDEVYWAIKSALTESADVVRKDIIGSATSRQPTFSVPVFENNIKQMPISFIKPVMQNTMAEPPATYVSVVSVDEPTLQSYKIIGQLFDTFIIIEIENKIVLVDQHAAHERMLYEKLLVAKKQKQISSQILLSPVALTFSPKEFSMLKGKMDLFTGLGFEMEDFGNNAILIRQTPVELGEDGLKSLIVELLGKIGNNMNSNREDEMLYTIACKAAVKANRKLQEREINALIDDILRTDGVNTCPHGRPLMITITRYELEKMFKRVQ